MDHLDEELRRLELYVFVGATVSAALANFQQLRIPSPWLDTIPQAVLIRAGNFFRAFLHAFSLPSDLNTFLLLLPPAAGGVLPSVPACVSDPRNSPPTGRPVLAAATRFRPLDTAGGALIGPAFDARDRRPGRHTLFCRLLVSRL